MTHSFTTKKFTVTRNDHQTTLLELLAKELSCSKKSAKRLLDARKVFVNNRRTWMAKHLVRAGDRIEVQASDEVAETISPQILFENSNFLVVAKPSGIISDGSESIESVLRDSRAEPLIRAVHRLDRDTTGCLLFARNEPARQSAIREFDAQRVTKRYLAIVLGPLRSTIGSVDAPIDGKPAKTIFNVLDSNPRGALLEATLVTGRMHQIRRHLGTRGLAVAGDKQYRSGVKASRAARAIPRQMLHAWKLQIPALHINCIAKPPDDMRELFDQLQLTLPRRSR